MVDVLLNCRTWRDGCVISATPHKTLNISKGVILCRELHNCDKKETLSELQNQYVKDIANISTKDDSDICTLAHKYGAKDGDIQWPQRPAWGTFTPVISLTPSLSDTQTT